MSRKHPQNQPKQTNRPTLRLLPNPTTPTGGTKPGLGSTNRTNPHNSMGPTLQGPQNRTRHETVIRLKPEYMGPYKARITISGITIKKIKEIKQIKEIKEIEYWPCCYFCYQDQNLQPIYHPSGTIYICRQCHIRGRH